MAGGAFAASPWKTVDQQSLEAVGRAAALTPWIQPEKFHAVSLDESAMYDGLAGAPHEEVARSGNNSATLELPLPDGSTGTFKVVDSPIMKPELEAWMAKQGYPMKTFKVTKVDDPTVSGRIDFGGPAGFHGMIRSPEGMFYIDPYWKENTDLYTSYYRTDLTNNQSWQCHFEEEVEATKKQLKEHEAADLSRTSGNLRSFDTAVAATGEYTTFHGGSVASGQAAIITAINRVNEVFETDMSVRLILIGNNNLIVYTNGGTDPYTNSSGFSMLGENESNLNSVIGSGNYDLGHVFSTGGGGVASLGSLCTSSKARGVTGQGSPIGDPFYIDYVSHEMGHQFGALHTFNSTTGSCGGGNRSGSAAFEPGSATTIMGYAGICGSDNTQSNSDPYFHYHSLAEMFAHLNSGGSCYAATPNVNPNEPTVDAGPNLTIPANTPFELTAVGSDADLDGSLTYCWEQYDLGPASTVASGDNGSSPIFRSYDPTASPTRVFPRLQNLLAGSTPFGETLPTTNRSLNFRVTARDNDPDGGRWAVDSKTLTVVIPSGGQPFEVTSPNGGETVSGPVIVTWNDANTAINATEVDILLSEDGGQTYPHTLGTGVANDGSASVVFPNISTSTARLKIKGTGNVFFDVSNSNFIVEPGVPSPAFDFVTRTLDDNSGNGNGNGMADPGENLLTLDVMLGNYGNLDASNVSAELTTSAVGVTVVASVASFPDLSVGADASASSLYSFAIDPSWNCGDGIPFDLEVTSTENTQTLSFVIATGAVDVSSTMVGFEAAEDLSGWSSSASSGANNWSYRTGGSSDGTPSGGSRLASYESGAGAVTSARLVSPSILVEAGMTLEFQHGYDIESGYDGAILEVSTNGGSSWTNAGSLITVGGYNGGISTGFGSPIGGQSAWTGDSPAMSGVSVDLDSYAGQTIQIAWRWTSDESIASDGWWIDDVEFIASNLICEPASSTSVDLWELY